MSSIQKKELIRELLDMENSVYRWCQRYLQNSTAAEDATQEVLIQAWQGIEGFKGEASLKTWVLRIAKNLCLNRLRSGRKIDVTGHDEEPGNLIENMANSSHPQLKTEQEILCCQIRTMIRQKAVAHQPPWDTLDYMIFELKFLSDEDMKWPAIAGVLGKPEDTVKYRFYNRIRPVFKELKKELEAEWSD